MISLQELKDKLGDEAKKYSEEELIKLREDMDGLANFLLDAYVDKLKGSKKV